MRVVIQRVTKAQVNIENKIVGKIGKGLLVLVGFEPEDTQEDFTWIANKIIQLRVFNDDNSIMNLSLQDIKGDLLIVSQFTLHASTKKGNRPSYLKASKPDLAKSQYNLFLEVLKKNYLGKIQTGVFGANMQVELLNNGPVTICIDSKNKE